MSKKIAFVLTKDNEELLARYYTYTPDGCRLNVSAVLNRVLSRYLHDQLEALAVSTYATNTDRTTT